MASNVCSHVKVVVRVRPTNEKEKSENVRNVVQVVDKHMLVFDPKEEEISCFGSQRVRNRNINKRANKDLKFVFDHVFGENSTQDDIFENTTKGVLNSVMNGFNCTVFAYGATGAGKTHTMLGAPNEPGVMYRTMKDLFKRMDDAKEEKEFSVAVSYLEVYNEQIRDLLANAGPLAVREDSVKGVVVQGLTLYQPKSAENILQALDSGNRNRTQHPTDTNATSSRSHAVFQIYLRQQDKTAMLNPNVCVAKMSLIDLAGSERASATNAKGQRLREGANINRSLLALGNVINALADPKLKSNVISLDSHIGQYAVICEKQRQEIVQLKQKLQEYEERKLMSVSSNAISPQKKADVKRVSEFLQQVFSVRAQIRSEQLDLERQLKENELRQRYSEEDNLQVQYIAAKEKTDKATCKHERKIAMLRTKQQHIHKRLKEAEMCFQNNDGWLHRIENEMRLLKSNDLASEVLEKDLHCHRLELQVNDLKQHIKQMVKITALQDQENKRMQKMVNVLLPAYGRCYTAMHDAGLVTAQDELQNHELEQIVLRERCVAWADQAEVDPDVQGSSTRETTQETKESGNFKFCGELAPVLSFSQLLYHQSSPCSAERRTKSVSIENAPSPKGSKSHPNLQQDILPQKNTRRNLSVLLPAVSPKTFSKDFQDGTFPLQYTPEPAQRDVQFGFSTAMDLDMTFEIQHKEDAAIINNDGPSQTAPTHLINPFKANEVNQIPTKRHQLSVQEMRQANPTYMGMTSAAQGKRKLNRERDENMSAPKRVKKALCVPTRPMRVPKFSGSEEDKPQRVVRSISEGNLKLLNHPNHSHSFSNK
ncbi:kinesin-like protein KIF18A isoform X4 [Phyllopteryx taeniolatus]|uniref:kinesin-like protein KIF18A isoform X4 n=1 Tax=Phyllopteryx taeniolatus TaxID=161469 RepID=UPI002AD47C64|nr:kinesin-like protein KIF18A isoform X4 [Phyllopteryx taeniolatus]